MKFYRGRAENGQDKYTIMWDWWSMLLLGMLIGFYFGNLWGHSAQIKKYMEIAPNYSRTLEPTP